MAAGRVGVVFASVASARSQSVPHKVSAVTIFCLENAMLSSKAAQVSVIRV